MERIRRIVALALLLCPCGPAVAESPTVETALRKASRFVAQGDRALRVGDLNRAENGFSLALEALPDLPEGHLGLGRVLIQRRRFAEAYEEFRLAERSYARQNASLHRHQKQLYSDAQSDLAGLYRKLEILKSNIERYESASNSGSDRRIKRQVGEMNVLREDIRGIEREIRRLEAIARPSPESDGVPGQVYFFLGNALLNLGRLQEATTAWQTAARIDPDSAWVQNNLAVAFWKLGRLTEAQIHLQQAERLGFPVNSRFRSDLERALAEQAHGD